MERYRFALKWGVIFTAMGLLWMLLERLLGLHDERIEMQESVRQYNDAVIEGQKREGRLATVEPIGSRLGRSQGVTS